MAVSAFACAAVMPESNSISSREVGVASANVFYFGHSLVGQDMPLMVGSFAAARGRRYAAHAQIGWGTTLGAHWNWNGVFDEHAPLGFEKDSRGRALFAGEGKAQLATGVYDVLVLTESNGHTATDGTETVKYGTLLAREARRHAPEIRIFLYANWLDRKEFDSLEAWRQRTDQDLAWWESVADRISASLEGDRVQVIPGGQILAQVTREIESGRIVDLSVDDLFREGDGVHVNDLGFYAIALAHYAAIFRDTPIGLPKETQTEDGPAETLSDANAARIQHVVWDYLEHYSRPGIAP